MSAAPYTADPSLLAVTVDATATVQTTFGGLMGLSTMTVNAHAIAAIPSAQPVITLKAGGGSPSQLLATSGIKTDAQDWNSIYMYGVPKNINGNYNYTNFPTFNVTNPQASQFYEVGSNCNGSVNSNWSSSSVCNSAFGAVAPVVNSFYIPPDQPIAFMFVNMNSGELSSGQGYGANAYSSLPGWPQIMTTATMSLGQSVTENTNNSASTIKSLTNFNVAGGVTKYPTSQTSSSPNCAVQIVQVDPNNLPTVPPSSGQCFATNGAGSQFANLSCNQIAGRTFMYWWNDMGGKTTDDKDYNDLSFTLTCTPGAKNPDGGTLYQSSTQTKGTPVKLLQ